MNRSPPSALQLGDGPELQGFRGARFIGGTGTEGKREALSTAQQPLALVDRRPSCTTHCLKLWFSINKQLRCPHTGCLETYVAVEQLICGGTGGIGPLCGIGPARLSVLYLKLLQLQQKMSLLVHDAPPEHINLPADVLFILELLAHIKGIIKTAFISSYR